MDYLSIIWDYLRIICKLFVAYFRLFADYLYYWLIFQSFCDFVYTSDEFAFNPIDVLSVDILLVNVAESAFKAIAVLRVL